MEADLEPLYKVLVCYKHSLIKTLNEIDESILQAVRNYDRTNTCLSLLKKYKISMEMSAVLQNYIKMLHTNEVLAVDLKLKIDELERDVQPERDRRNSNPFILSNVGQAMEIRCLSPFAKKTETSLLNEASVAVESDLETIVDVPVEELITIPEQNSIDVKNLFNVPEEEICITPFDVKEEKTQFVIAVPNLQEKTKYLDNSDLSTDTIKHEAGTSLEENCEVIEKNETELSIEAPPLKEKEEILFEDGVKPLEQEISSNLKKQEKKVKSQGSEGRKVSFKLPTEDENIKSIRDKSYIQASTFNKSVQLPPHNWREEAIKLLENKNLRKNFKMRVAPLSQGEGDQRLKEKNVTFEITQDELFVNQQCVFCHVESPSEFYIRSQQPLFERLENALNEDINAQSQYVVNTCPSKAQAKASFGNFCFGFLKNKGKWFRMEVLDWMDSKPDLIRVQLIDYGERFFCNYVNLKAMTEVYAMFPRMAIRCHFAGIYSPNPYSRRKWSKASCEFLLKCSAMDTMTTFVPIYVHREGNSYAVDLQRESDLNADTLGQILVSNGFACEVEITEEDKAQSDLDEYENLNEAITGYDAKDEARICPFTDRRGKCFKGPSCKLEHSKLSEDGVTTDKVLTMNQAFNTLILPSAGQTVEVLITGYIDTCHFYAHILENRTQDCLFNEGFKNIRDLMKANNKVQTYEIFKIYPGIGELVLVKNESEWCRGTCVAYADNEGIEVFLRDYGYKVTKHFKELRQMKEDFLYVPFQAVECIIHDCQEKKSVSVDDSQNFFVQFMYMQRFMGYVMESGEPLRLKLLEQNGLDLGYVLKQYGLAEDRVKDFYPPPNCILSCE